MTDTTKLQSAEPELTMESVEQDKTIVIITTDRLGLTGRFSWKYMFCRNSDHSHVVPNKVQDIIVNLPFAFLWVDSDELRNPTEERKRPYNVFDTKGFKVGGGFEPFVDRSYNPFSPHEKYDIEAEKKKHDNWQQKMLDAIPACSMLMASDDFEWLKDHILDKSGRSYVRYHCDQPLFSD